MRSHLDRSKAITQAYTDSNAHGQNALIVCATHEEIDRVTEAIRLARKDRGKLDKTIEMSRDVSLNWTTAQKSEMENYRPGQLLKFHRSMKGIGRNEVVEVEKIENGRLIERNERGQSLIISTRKAKSFDVFDRRSIEVAAADRLLLTANCRISEFRCTNGEIVTVSHVDSRGRFAAASHDGEDGGQNGIRRTDGPN